jgi:hypothetical protein
MLKKETGPPAKGVLFFVILLKMQSIVNGINFYIAAITFFIFGVSHPASAYGW